MYRMPSVVQRAIAARPAGTRLVLLCDFDGTLAELHQDPFAPTLLPERRELLEVLAGRRDMSVGLVSGRRISDLRGRTRLPQSVYHAGLHGLEIEVDDRRWRHPELEDRRQSTRALMSRLKPLTREVPGMIIEDKDVSIAVHVRSVSTDRRDEALGRARALAAPFLASGDLALLGGQMILEFLPNLAWNKGDAKRWILEDVASRFGGSPWVVFIGDDVTDENAFAAIEHGIGVLVGDRPTAAAHRLSSPSDVEELLRWLATPGNVKGAS
jgi:trehalose 6-phosphate phosphatase